MIRAVFVPSWGWAEPQDCLVEKPGTRRVMVPIPVRTRAKPAKQENRRRSLAAKINEQFRPGAGFSRTVMR